MVLYVEPLGKISDLRVRDRCEEKQPSTLESEHQLL